MNIYEFYKKFKAVKLKHSVITWGLILLCMFIMVCNNINSTKKMSNNIILLQEEVASLKDSQTYILLELKESEQNVKSIKSTLIQNTKYIDELIEKYSKKYGVDPKLAHAVAIVESGKNQNTKNGSTIGVMQIKPSTAKGMGIHNVYTPEGNIEAGVKYLAYLKNKFNGNEDKIISAYNAGPNAGQSKGVIPNKKYVQKVQAVKSKL